MKYITIHCSDTPKGKYFDVSDIRKWHVEERGWSDIGYHYIILLDGTIEIGRDINTRGAHVKDYNTGNIGICYIGGENGTDTRTIEQKASLVHLICTLKRIYKGINVLGHRDFPNVTKKCPGYDSKNEYKNL